MKVVAFVPIKLNNERLPNKNITSFTNGKPLITYILNTLLKVKNIDESYVFCSDEAIIPYLPDGIKFLKRSPELDTQATRATDLLGGFMEMVDADVYVMTHATAPFARPETLELGVEKVCSGEYDSALAVTKLQNFFWMNGKPANYDPKKTPRTQDLPDVYEETAVMYVVSKDLFVAERVRIGNKPYLVEVSKIEAIDIDNKEDFIIADAIYNYLNGNYNNIADGGKYGKTC